MEIDIAHSHAFCEKALSDQEVSWLLYLDSLNKETFHWNPMVMYYLNLYFLWPLLPATQYFRRYYSQDICMYRISTSAIVWSEQNQAPLILNAGF